MHVIDSKAGAAVHAAKAAEVISRWLDGRYQAGDEPEMLHVIRRETCSDLSDAEIKRVVYAASDRGSDAAAVLNALFEADRLETAAGSSQPR